MDERPDYSDDEPALHSQKEFMAQSSKKPFRQEQFDSDAMTRQLKYEAAAIGNQFGQHLASICHHLACSLPARGRHVVCIVASISFIDELHTCMHMIAVRCLTNEVSRSTSAARLCFDRTCRVLFSSSVCRACSRVERRHECERTSSM